MADGVVRIVLNAIDKYSGVLTGLNQGLELVSKAMSAVRAASDIAFGAISKGLDLAVKGGQYREMKSQFDAVAATYKQNGDQIIKSLDAISNNSLKLTESVSLAGKAITSGLGGPAIEKVFAFVKKRTEMTGEDFKAMSESVFNAIQSGRFSVLKQMGLVIEKGDGLAQILGKMEVATKAYGEAAFNAGDKVEAMSTASENFWTKIGVAINDAPLFQRAITYITDTVTDFVNSFDTRQLSRFVEYFLRVGQTVLEVAKASFGGVVKVIYDSFAGTTTTGVVQGFVQNVLAAFTALAQTAATVGKFMANAVSMVSSGWSTILDVVGSAIVSVSNLVDELDRYVTDKVFRMVRGIAATFRDWVSSSGDLAYMLGIDKLSEGMNAAEDAARGMLETANKHGPEIGQKIGLGFLDAAEKAEKFAQSMAADTLGDGFVAFTQNLANQVANIKFPELKEIDISSPVKQVAELANGFKAADQAAAQVQETSRKIKPELDLTGLKGGKIDVQADLKTSPLQSEMERFLAAVNWPAEFRAMGEYFFKFILSLARGERVPLTVQGVA